MRNIRTSGRGWKGSHGPISYLMRAVLDVNVIVATAPRSSPSDGSEMRAARDVNVIAAGLRSPTGASAALLDRALKRA